MQNEEERENSQPGDGERSAGKPEHRLEGAAEGNKTYAVVKIKGITYLKKNTIKKKPTFKIANS